MGIVMDILDRDMTLNQRIELLRRVLNDFAERRASLTDEGVIQISKQLDQLLNQFHARGDWDTPKVGEKKRLVAV
ncbi:MAG: Spo0E like sporulation regulatory protein [Paenibacillaceae bacterium]|nr:Spo0E like sporulation regulatory protein [Paenibacillaceae bacterium]